MTTITTNIKRATALAFLQNGLGRIKTWAVRECERYARIKSRRDQIETLEALSDDDLARIGLTRDTIVWHVFRDKFYS